MKVFGQMLIGAVVGFFGMYILLSSENNAFLLPATAITMVLIIISLIGTMVSLIMIVQIKKRSKEQVVGEAEDERDRLLYTKFSDATMAASIGMILGVSSISVSVITDQEMWMIISAGVVLIINMIVYPFVTATIKYVYPDREMPPSGDKEYGKKLLAMADEGERHIMLEGLYKVFFSINALLPMAIILLMFYSVATGDSQLFGVIVITLIFIFVNTRYLFSIRNK